MAEPLDLTPRLRAVQNIGTRAPVDGGGDGPHDPTVDLTERVAKIESRLDATLPTLLTESKFHEAMHAQTWKLVTAALAVAGLIIAGIKLIH